jgi:hypothetical protein|nr:leucine-rich repeat protein [Ruminococcus bromii]
MKKHISVVLLISVLLSFYSSRLVFAYDVSEENNIYSTTNNFDIGNSGFLSDEVADKFVKLFYSQNSNLQSSVKEILTGKKKGSLDEIKGIYNNAVSFFKLLDKNAVEMVVSKGAAVAVENISNLTNLVSGVISIYDNGNSFVNSTNAMQKTIDGLQILSSTMSIIGCSAYIPSSMSIVLSSTEFALALGGYLEKSYFKENATLYQYELEIAYQTDDEIPYREAPKITIGSGVTQEEADSIFSQLYIEYCVKRMLKTIDKNISIDDEMYEWPVGVTIDLLDPGVSTDSVRFRYDEFYMFMDESLTNIYAHPFPRNASIGNEISNYTVSDPSVIAYDSNRRKVTSLNPGIAYIQATTTNGIRGTCKITVLPYSAERIKNTNQIILKKYYLNDSEVKVPNKVGDSNVTEIGANCFRNCNKIKSVVISDGIKVIGDKAFIDCKNIKNIYIPDSVEKIGEGTFSGCESIESIDIPDKVKEIGSSSFSHCENLKDVKLPTNLQRINPYLFYWCLNLKSVVIPDNVTSIGEQSFFRCESLNTVEIGKNVTFIGDYAFTRCRNLYKVSMNKKVNIIGESAFANCVSLKEIELPDSLTSIETGAFYGTNLNNIVIPNHISVIKSLAFAAVSNVQSIELPDNITSIEEKAFASCYDLTDIKIPNSVSKIGKGAFAYCKKLKNISFSNSISEISDNMFYQCGAIENIVLPNGITTIGESAFSECSNLKNIVLSNKLVSIDDNAFNNCTKLLNITIGENVTHIGEAAFSNCINCKDINVEKDNQFYSSIDGVLFDKEHKKLKCYPAGKEDTSYTVPDGVLEIETKAFYGCSHLTGTFKLPKSVEYIGEYALYKTRPTKMIIPFIGSKRGGDILDTEHRSNQFMYYFNESFLPTIKEVEITDETILAQSAFWGLYDITSLKLNEGITKICDKAFDSCGVNITSIVIPSTVNSIGMKAFDGLVNLKTLYFKNSIERWSVINNITNNDYLNDINIYCLGNVDCDSKTSINDATVIQKYIVRLNELNGGQQFVADIDGDGELTVSDVTKLQKYIVNDIDSLN